MESEGDGGFPHNFPRRDSWIFAAVSPNAAARAEPTRPGLLLEVLHLSRGGGGAGQAGYGLDERDRKGVGVCVFCGGWAVLWKHLHMFRQYLQQAAHRPRQRHIHMLWVCSALPRGTRLIYAWEASARDVASDLRRAHIASRLVVVV